VFYAALLSAAGNALLDVGMSKIHARLGVLTILHTWGQNLMLHPHVHCVVPGGGFSVDGRRWIGVRKATYLLPVNVLKARFRTLLCQALRKAAEKGELARLPAKVLPHATIEGAAAQKWVVYAKAPFGGPRQVLQYLSRYTHRVAISNRRIVSFTGGKVTFEWRDYRDGNRKKRSTVDAMEFVRRFLLHVLPDRFVRIRYFGFLTNARRVQNIERARELIGVAEPDIVRERPKFQVLCPECMAIVYGRNESRSSDPRTDRPPPFIEDAA
jgi:head-tail adaptor